MANSTSAQVRANTAIRATLLVAAPRAQQQPAPQPPAQKQPGFNQNQADPDQGVTQTQQPQLPLPVPAQPLTMDTYLPRVPDVNQPIFLRSLRRTVSNAIAIKSPFGSSNHGHWDSVTSTTLYNAQMNEVWTVPSTNGVYSTFPANIIDAKKNASQQSLSKQRLA